MAGSFRERASCTSVQTARRRRSHSFVTPAVLKSVEVELSKWLRSAAAITSSAQFSVSIAPARRRFQNPPCPENGFFPACS